MIFTSRLSAPRPASYDDTAARMVELAAAMPGYLGHDAVRGEDGLGITVSYWRSEEDIARWRAHPEHARAIAKGRSGWYSSYESLVTRVERASSLP